MLSLDLPAAQFNYRVAAVIVHGDQVLLHRAETEAFWSLPGGRCEAGEISAAALARELREEIGTAIQVERLLWTVELFFTLAGRRYHELGLYHLATLPTGSSLLDMGATYHGQEDHDSLDLLFRWFPLAATGDLFLVPRFLRTALRDLPSGVEHVVSVERLDEEDVPQATGAQ